MKTLVKSRRRRPDVEYLLTGKLYCGHCKSAMTGSSGTGKSGNMYYYYRCHKQAVEKTCNKKAVPKDSIEQLVVRAVKDYVLQDEVIEKIAAMGSNCVIVGRNADVILRNHAPFNLFVCASTDAKIKRCMERAGDKEALSEKELHRKMKQIDKSRARTREMISDSEWGQRDAYHLIVNTTDWNLRELAPIVGRFASAWFEKMEQQV